MPVQFRLFFVGKVFVHHQHLAVVQELIIRKNLQELFKTVNGLQKNFGGILTFSCGGHSINNEVSDFNQIFKENGESEKKSEVLPSFNKVSLSNIPNFGRKASTRDLKLCCVDLCRSDLIED
jgi:hypothetical protein